MSKKEEKDKKDEKKEEEKSEKKTEKKEVNIKIDPDELGKHGLHFGHSSSKRHPNMDPYIDGVKGEVHIFDLIKTAEKLEQALRFLGESKNEGKAIMIVGTKPQTETEVKKLAEKHKIPYITYRWIGGFMTNFSEIKKRIDHLNELLEKREKGEFDKYTKMEQLEIDREIESLEKKFGGVKEMSSLPDILFALNADKDELALEEARQKDIKIVAVCDSNTDPRAVDYPIPANDDAVSSIKFILNKFDEALS